MSKIKQILRFLFNRSINISQELLAKKIKHCERLIYIDSIVFGIYGFLVILFNRYVPDEFGLAVCFFLCMFSVWLMMDFCEWNRLNNIYIKFYKGGNENGQTEQNELKNAKDQEKD